MIVALIGVITPPAFAVDPNSFDVNLTSMGNSITVNIISDTYHQAFYKYFTTIDNDTCEKADKLGQFKWVHEDTFTITDLQPDTQYLVKVKINYIDGEQSEFQSYCTTTLDSDETLPYAQNSFDVNLVSTENSITANIISDTYHQAHYRYFTTPDSTTCEQATKLGDVKWIFEDTFTITDLQPDTQYLVKVKINYDDGEQSEFQSYCTTLPTPTSDFIDSGFTEFSSEAYSEMVEGDDTSLKPAYEYSRYDFNPATTTPGLVLTIQLYNIEFGDGATGISDYKLYYRNINSGTTDWNTIDDVLNYDLNPSFDQIYLPVDKMKFLSPWNTYVFYMSIMNDNGYWSDVKISDYKELTYNTNIIEAPIQNFSVQGGDNNFTFTWDDSISPKSYFRYELLSRVSDSADDWKMHFGYDITSPLVLTSNSLGLSDNTMYDFKMRLITDSFIIPTVWSNISGPAISVDSTVSADPPTNVINKDGVGEFTFEWKNPLNTGYNTLPLTTYQIESSLNGVDWQTFTPMVIPNTGNGEFNTVTISSESLGLTNDVPYHFKIRVYTDVPSPYVPFPKTGMSFDLVPFELDSLFVLRSIPGMIGFDKIIPTFIGNGATSIDKFQLQSSSSLTPDVWVTHDEITLPDTIPFYLNAQELGLEENAKYYFKARVLNDLNYWSEYNSVKSHLMTIKPLDEAKPSPVTDFTAINNDDGSFTFNWTDPLNPGDPGYNYGLFFKAIKFQSHIVDSPDNWITHDELSYSRYAPQRPLTLTANDLGLEMGVDYEFTMSISNSNDYWSDYTLNSP